MQTILQCAACASSRSGIGDYTGMFAPDFRPSSRIEAARRDGRVAEGARLESVYTLTGIVGSNPTLSASFSFPLLTTAYPHIESQIYSRASNVSLWLRQ